MNSRDRKRKAQRYLSRQADKIKNEGTMSAINILQVIPLYLLATEHGYGNIRLEQFLTRLYSLTEQVSRDIKILDRMCDVLEHDKGIKISFSNNDNRVENIWRDKGDTRKVIHKRNGKKGT